MTEKHLLYNVEKNVARLTINREAQRNAISLEAIDLISKFLDEAEADDKVRVILITGSGDKAFCSGADLGGAVDGKIQQGFKSYAALITRLSSYPKPVVARINGLWPMMIGALIYRNVLRKKAMEMILLGERLTADQALSMGLITRAVPPDKLDQEVNQILKSLAAKSPIGMKIGKEAFYAMADMPFEQAVDFLSGKIAEVAATEDAREGITAFIEKRTPEFQGK
jgi:enoyl-CoA hydratase/carnithine racemase